MYILAGIFAWRRSVCATLLVLAPISGVLATNVRPSFLDTPSEVVLPVGYNRNRQYPVFLVMPPTGVRASSVAARLGLDPRQQEEFVLILPPGRATRNDYLPDFLGFVGWYEERILADVSRVLEDYSVDPNRIYLGGYSLGGDLSWALAVRNPETFAGAVVAGSRASHPVDQEALDELHRRGFRGAFLIGDREDPDRHRGINFARARFDHVGIEFRYREYPGGHVMPASATFQDEIRYIAQVDSLPDPAVPVRRRQNTPATSGLFGHTTRDRIALRVGVPAEVGDGGFSAAGRTDFRVRVEWPWQQAYLRTTASYRTDTRTTDNREHTLQQDLLLGIGNDRGYYGAGLGWTWWNRFPDGAAYETVDLLLMHGIRDPWLIPVGTADPQRVDSLLVLRYQLPRNLGQGVADEQLLNLRAEYLLRIADRFVIDAAAGAYTVQNRPVDSLGELSDALDRRLEWELGLGVRLPSPVLWRVGYRGTESWALSGDDEQRSYRDVWTLTLEYSF